MLDTNQDFSSVRQGDSLYVRNSNTITSIKGIVESNLVEISDGKSYVTSHTMIIPYHPGDLKVRSNHEVINDIVLKLNNGQNNNLCANNDRMRNDPYCVDLNIGQVVIAISQKNLYTAKIAS